MRLVGFWLSASLLIANVSCAVAGPQKTNQSAVTETKDVVDLALRQVVTVLIRKANGQQLGSGVLVAEATGGLWVASNRHVVADQTTVCVVKADRTTAAALVMPVQSKQKQEDLDLALIWLPQVPQGAAVVADISDKAATVKDLPVVVATGFPVSLSGTSIDGPAYSERPGLLVPLLKEPLQEGLDLAYTSVIEKGMSGGGVFLGSALIGINSAHREPLWPGQWLDARGRAVDEKLNEKLNLVSLGLSGKQIKQAIKSASLPKKHDLKQLVSVECNQPVPPAQPAQPKENPSTKW